MKLATAMLAAVMSDSAVHGQVVHGWAKFRRDARAFMDVLDDIVKVQTASKEELLGKLKTAIEKIDQIIESHKNSANNELKEIKTQLEALMNKTR